MKTDKIFYTLFQIFPELIFLLLGEATDLAADYEFKSVTVKELQFTKDGVLLPKNDHPEYLVYFTEVQFQNDPEFYGRLFTEIIMYLRQYPPHKRWKAVVLWGNRKIESEIPLHYQCFDDAGCLERVYLNELNLEDNAPICLQIIDLITTSPKKAQKRIKQIEKELSSQFPDPLRYQEIVELIEKVLVYKFPKLSRQELQKMFAISDLKETRIYQEIMEETEQKITEKVKLETLPKLLKAGLSVSKIAEILELDVNVVRDIARQQKAE